MADNLTSGVPPNNTSNALGITGNRGFPQSLFRNRRMLLLVGVVIIALILIAVAIFALRSQPEGNPKIVYWGLWEDKQIFDGVIADFQREHPNVEVVYQKQNIKSLGKYIDRLTSKMNTNNEPDVFRFHNSWVLQLQDYLLPLPSDVVSASELESKHYDVVKKDLQLNGAYYGVPLEIDTLALIINDDMFKNAGITSYPVDWDDLVKTARLLTVKDANRKIKQGGVAMGTYDNVDHASDLLSLLFIQNGADLKDLTGPKRKNAEDALSFYTSFTDFYEGVWDETFESSKLAFAKGRVAMIFGYSWDALDIKALNPKLNVVIVPVPHLPGREMTIASYWVEGVSSKTKYPKEAFEFLKFLSKRETIEKLYAQESKLRLFGEPYSRTDMADLLKGNPLIYPFVQLAKNAQSTIFSSDTYDGGMNLSLNAYFGNAIRSVAGGTGSIRSSLETLNDGVKSVLKRYEKPTTATK